MLLIVNPFEKQKEKLKLLPLLYHTAGKSQGEKLKFNGKSKMATLILTLVLTSRDRGRYHLTLPLYYIIVKCQGETPVKR